MTFLLLGGCTAVTLDAPRRVLGGCVFYEMGMLQDRFFVILVRFCGSGTSRAAGGRQEAHPDAQQHEEDIPRLRNGLPFGRPLKAGGIIFQSVFLDVFLVRFL